jgi:hypothetical protein
MGRGADLEEVFRGGAFPFLFTLDLPRLSARSLVLDLYD